MDLELLAICALTFVIHLIGALAYAVRIAGVRTRRIAISFALFNILVLVSRTSNSFQGPFLAKRIEEDLASPLTAHVLSDLRWILLTATLATLVGALAVPTFQRLFSRAVLHFQVHRSIAKMLLHGFAKGGLGAVREALTPPRVRQVTALKGGTGLPIRVIAMNVAAQALLTVGIYATFYAGYLEPDFRVTASSLSAVVNGVATLLLFVFIDPQLSVMTDDVVDGRVSEPAFRRAVVALSISRVAGTLVAQALLVPAAYLVVFVARSI
ncbi:lipid II flippase Amj family protein [Allosphingosinicella deserti]|uniref:Lipid II flippase Amj n=1 Tax=Allosphingosinicella deserti TaxID=2116704 RepID=A0A2P7R093_9SPHN|nr:lipid II flippase Amj family protein [Sphingomonas deserti]PSJ43631.1 DUF2837 domain-containing protein [Sphingomonas deserti]